MSEIEPMTLDRWNRMAAHNPPTTADLQVSAAIADRERMLREWPKLIAFIHRVRDSSPWCGQVRAEKPPGHLGMCKGCEAAAILKEVGEA